MNQSAAFAGFAGFFLIISISPDAFAYIDPSAGSAILQGILGAVAALSVALGLYWHRLLNWFHIRKKSAQEKQ